MEKFLHDLTWVLPLRSDVATPVFQFFSWLGYTAFFLLSLPVIFWTLGRKIADRVAIPTVLAAVAMYFLKDLCQDPRPPAELSIEGTRPDSFGFPSGHTLIAIVFWSSLAFELRKQWFTILAVILILGIAFSRLYLGVHDVEDVLGGLLFGFLILGGSRLVLSPRIQSTASRLSVVGLSALALVPITSLLVWPNQSPPGGMFLLSGFLPAWIAGASLQAWFIPASRIAGWKILPGALLGFLLLFGLEFGLKTFFRSVETPKELAQICAGILFGFAVTLAIPALFRLLKLENRTVVT